MAQNIKKIKKLRVFGLCLIVFGLIYFGYTLIAAAQTASSTAYVKDSDYDGLSDQAEADIYRTDPLKVDTDGDGYLDAAEVLSGSNPLSAADPASSLAGQNSESEENEAPSSLPWYIARSAGIGALVLMFLIIVLGVGMTTGYIYRYLNPVKSWMTHKYLSLALGLVLITHITALLFDNFINLGLKDVLIPFHSNFNPPYLSLGILGFYILLVVIFTSIWFRLKYKKTWRSVHYFVYALFAFSVVHGFFMGTDSRTMIMQAVYISTSLIFLLILIYRFIIRPLKR
jgi:DMSO/TMAO reductase YedYZ heme-binding membrane subunit